MEKFQRPTHVIRDQDAFTEREIGITHPDLPTHVRLTDNGDIEIIAGDGLGIILSRATRTIILVGDTVKFLTKEEAGLSWNKNCFNARATVFNQPALIEQQAENYSDLYRGIEHYFGDEE